jgi:hypothetical protein
MMNDGPAPLQRYIPLACWVAVLLTCLFICLKIIGYGYLPPGDARRHAAKPFANKPYSQIVVMKPEYVVDHSPGWEWLLGELHGVLKWDEDDLMSFSIASLLLLIFCLPLLWMRRPEAWMAALLAELIAMPNIMSRLTQARPYLLTEGFLIAYLFAWTKDENKNPPWYKIVLTFGGFALSAWMHGAWYLWVVLLAAFFLAQRWRACLWLTGCWVAGTVMGALLTGKPVAFLYGAVFMAASVYQEHAAKWLLVGEFQPSEGEFLTLILLALVYVWRKAQNKVLRPLFLDPIFWMIAINWILGLTADRFWADWGLAAVFVWLAVQFDDIMPVFTEDGSFKRLVVCGLILPPLFLITTNDYGRRYTFSLDTVFVEAGDPNLKGWLPEKGGIFYADDMEFFYDTFYKNPTADWRYILGFEPALMPAEDLKIYRAIHRNGGALESYEPWIKKMRPQDRLALDRSSQPALPELEWNRCGNFGIGRLPQRVIKK